LEKLKHFKFTSKSLSPLEMEISKHVKTEDKLKIHVVYSNSLLHKMR